MYKLIHKPTRIKNPSATLLDNIYTNIHINIDSCKSGIITNNNSDNFFVFGIFDNMKINLSKILLKQDISQKKNQIKICENLKQQFLGKFKSQNPTQKIIPLWNSWECI